MIYIDEVIILNFIIDFIILKTMSSILKLNTKTIKLIISSLIGEITLITLFISLNNIVILLLELILSILMIYISFGYNDLKSFIKNDIYFITFLETRNSRSRSSRVNFW